jgi:uncharacterized protein (TIGR04255 family)
MKDKIDRRDFKYNFLKKVIIRIDYNGILDLDMDYTVRNIKDELYDQGFKIFQEGFINQVDFEIKDPELIETQMMIPINELKKAKSYNFSSEDMSQSIQITKYFAILNIDFGKYITFETYGKLFSIIVKHLKDSNKFLKILRIGLRKINNCILLDISKLNEYFEERYFENIIQPFIGENYELNLVNSQRSDSFHITDNDVNLIRFLSQGILDIDGSEKEAYQLVLDIDVYIRDEQHIAIVTDNEKVLYDKLIEMNTLLFFVYTQMLKEQFIQKLQSETFSDNIVLGVEKND